MQATGAEKQNDTQSTARLWRILRGHPLGALLQFAVPTVLALLSTSLYHLVDARYVSTLDPASSAAIGIAFPLQMLYQAVGFTFGTGGGCLLSRALGGGRKADAAQYGSLAFLGALITGLALGGLGLLLSDPLLRLLGAGEETLDPARTYIRNLLLAAPFLCASPALGLLLRAKGHPWLSSIGLCAGNLLNILLDPLFLLVLPLGIGGASLATLLGQGLGFFLLLFLSHRFSPGRSKDFSSLRGNARKKGGSILLSGAPSLVRQGFLAIATVLLNRFAADEGVSAVSAMSIVNRLFLLGFAFCAGVAQGAVPLLGYHLGSGRERYMRRTLLQAVLLSCALMLGLSVPLLLFPKEILELFHADAEALRVGIPALRAQAAVFVLHGVITCTTLALQVCGKQGRALLLAAARQGFFLLPLLWWITARFGHGSFIYAQPVADLLTFLLTLPFLLALLLRKGRVSSRNNPDTPSPRGDTHG